MESRDSFSLVHTIPDNWAEFGFGKQGMSVGRSRNGKGSVCRWERKTDLRSTEELPFSYSLVNGKERGWEGYTARVLAKNNLIIRKLATFRA